MLRKNSLCPRLSGKLGSQNHGINEDEKQGRQILNPKHSAKLWALTAIRRALIRHLLMAWTRRTKPADG
jgi:hypothetical protein